MDKVEKIRQVMVECFDRCTSTQRSARELNFVHEYSAQYTQIVARFLDFVHMPSNRYMCTRHSAHVLNLEPDHSCHSVHEFLTERM